jgi:hypothetical protein
VYTYTPERHFDRNELRPWHLEHIYTGMLLVSGFINADICIHVQYRFFFFVETLVPFLPRRCLETSARYRAISASKPTLPTSLLRPPSASPYAPFTKKKYCIIYIYVCYILHIRQTI